MKLITNILIFIFVLCIPFALSSQTRKAIPAGRFEALSGIKVSQPTKTENIVTLSGQSNIWSELQKNLPADKNDFYYFKNYPDEINFVQVIPNKTFRELKRVDQGIDLLITANLQSDKDNIRHLKPKGFIVLISNKTIKEMISTLQSYDILAFSNQSNENYYLLKTK